MGEAQRLLLRSASIICHVCSIVSGPEAFSTADAAAQGLSCLVHTRIYIMSVCAHVYICIMRVRVCVHMYEYIYIRVCMQIYVYVYRCMCVYIYI